MDYEKKYKEALERAKDFHSRLNEQLKKEMENIFPELKESDDERIRENIIATIHLYYGEPLEDEAKEMIAWLEKQGEKSAWSEEDEKKRNLLISILNINHPNGYFKVNPANTLNMEAMHTEELVDWLRTLKDRTLPQPKQEWKQENTGDLTDFENAMMHIGGSFFGENAGLDPNDTNVVKEQANFLLGLAQSKEWSEEDDSHIRYLIECLEHCKKGVALTMTTSTSQEYINWLKSLKPQSRWKPSNEQMKALKEATDKQWDVDGDALWDLYQDLKKLTE
jgi:hypothetical protein